MSTTRMTDRITNTEWTPLWSEDFQFREGARLLWTQSEMELAVQHAIWLLALSERLYHGDDYTDWNTVQNLESAQRRSGVAYWDIVRGLSAWAAGSYVQHSDGLGVGLVGSVSGSFDRARFLRAWDSQDFSEVGRYALIGAAKIWTLRAPGTSKHWNLYALMSRLVDVRLLVDNDGAWLTENEVVDW